MERRVFAQLVAERKNALFGFALHMLGNVEDAEDVAQDVLVKLWHQGDEVDPVARGAWMMRVCRNACLDRLRRRKVRQRHSADPTVTAMGAGVPDLDEDASGREVSFDLSDQGAGALQIEHEVEIEQVSEAMQRLNEPQRSVIILRELHDMAYDDIAQALGSSLSSVKVSLHRDRKRLRELLTSGAEESHESA